MARSLGIEKVLVECSHYCDEVVGRVGARVVRLCLCLRHNAYVDVGEVGIGLSCCRGSRFAAADFFRFV